MVIYYLIVNGFDQPLLMSKSSQVHIYFKKEDAEKRINRTKKIDYIAGRERFIKQVYLKELK